MRLPSLSIIVGADDASHDSEAMRSLPRHELVHSDGRRLLVHEGMRGPLREAGSVARVHTGLGLFGNNVAPDDAERSRSRMQR
jgi:hypothetical protein